MPRIRDILDDAVMVEAKNKDGDIVHVDSVARGASCNCFCIYCGARVGARQGDINAHSFYHLDGDKDCPYRTILYERKRKEIQEKYQNQQSDYISLRDLLKNTAFKKRKEIDTKIKSGICPICNGKVSTYEGKNGISWISCENFKYLRSNCGCRLPLNTYLELLQN